MLSKDKVDYTVLTACSLVFLVRSGKITYGIEKGTLDKSFPDYYYNSSLEQVLTQIYSSESKNRSGGVRLPADMIVKKRVKPSKWCCFE